MKVTDGEFCEFVALRSHALLRTAYLLVGDAGHAEDLLQTALLKTYLARHRVLEHGALEAYVRRALVNSATSWWRRRWTGERPTGSLPDTVVADTAHEVAEAETMRRMLLTLPPKQRAAVVLRYYADLSEADVAAAMGVTRGTISRYLARALAGLRERIEVPA